MVPCTTRSSGHAAAAAAPRFQAAQSKTESTSSLATAASRHTAGTRKGAVTRRSFEVKKKKQGGDRAPLGICADTLDRRALPALFRRTLHTVAGSRSACLQQRGHEITVTTSERRMPPRSNAQWQSGSPRTEFKAGDDKRHDARNEADVDLPRWPCHRARHVAERCWLSSSLCSPSRVGYRRPHSRCQGRGARFWKCHGPGLTALYALLCRLPVDAPGPAWSAAATNTSSRAQRNITRYMFQLKHTPELHDG